MQRNCWQFVVAKLLAVERTISLLHGDRCAVFSASIKAACTAQMVLKCAVLLKQFHMRQLSED